MSEPSSITVPVPIPEKRIVDTLCTGLDPGYGGALYWIDSYAVIHPPPGERAPRYIHEHAYKYGIEISYDPSGGSDADPVLNKRLLNKKAIHKGLAIMAEKYPLQFGRLVSGNDDAITGDVLVQCAVFGELVFG